MEKFLQIILVASTVLEPKRVLADSAFETLNDCLLSKGVKSQNIIWRGYSSLYVEVNYQWQERGGLINPIGYLEAESLKDVQAGVDCGRQTKTRVVPLSGGHSYSKFSFGDQNTFIIDLQKMKALKINPRAGTVTMGPGVMLGSIYYNLWTNGRYFLPGGVCLTVGISGFTTGGGYGYFARKYGLMIDSLRELEIVLANGSHLTVNNNKSPDLYWALKGAGGGSLVIVTKLKFELHKAPPIVTLGSFKFNGSMFLQVFDTFQSILGNPNSIGSSVDLYYELVVTWTELELTIVNTNSSAGSIGQVLSLFPRPETRLIKTVSFLDFIYIIGTDPTTTEKILEGELKGPSDMVHLRRLSLGSAYIKNKSFFVRGQVSPQALNPLLPMLRKIPKNVIIYFESFGGIINRVAEGETSFIHRNNLYLGSASHYVSSSEAHFGDPKINSIGENWVKEYFKLTKKLLNHTTSYQNYVDDDLKNPLQRYYGTNLKRLIEIKRKYDPDNFFRNPQTIPTSLAGLI